MFRLKIWSDFWIEWIARGIVVHKTGEATEKERSPKVLSRVLGTASKFFSAERRLPRLDWK